MLELTDVFTTFPVLETERFILRAVVPEDAPDIFRLMGDPRVTRYLGRAPMASLDQAVRQVQVYRSTFEDQTGITWAITCKGQDRLIGTFVFWNLIQPHFRAEVGYILSPDWWGQGAMTEVARAALTFGFTTMGLHSVEARTDPENGPSKRLLEKLGFAQEGYFREDFYDPIEMRFTDTTVFSLLQSNFVA